MQLDADTTLNEHAVAQLVEHFQVIFSRQRTLSDTIGDSASAAGTTIFGRLAELQRKLTDLQRRSQSATDPKITGNCTERTTAGAVTSSLAELTTHKLTIVEGVMTVLNREMEKMTVDMEALETQRRTERELVDNMDRKVRSMERLIAMKDATINELSIRLTCVEQTSYDGTLLWRVPEVQKKRQEAVSGRVTSVYSPPFFTSRTGIHVN